MGLAFFPRGGSAHVARNLAHTLGEAGWDVTVLSGSITHPDEPGDAREFYRGLDVRPQDFTRAFEAPDPMSADPPMHPSYEDRPGAPDRVFASLDDAEYERQVTAWCRALQSVDAANADVLHLHHLTPIHEAAARVAPGVPIVGHLHGTELLMLEAIEADPSAGRTARRGRRACAGGRPPASASSCCPRASRSASHSCSGSARNAACWCRTGSTRAPSTRWRSTASHTGAATSWTSRADGLPASAPARFATPRPTWRRSRTRAARRPCSCMSGASPRSSGCRC